MQRPIETFQLERRPTLLDHPVDFLPTPAYNLRRSSDPQRVVVILLWRLRNPVALDSLGKASQDQAVQAA